MNPPTYEQLTFLVTDLGDILRNQEVRNEDEINQVIGALQTTLHILVMSKNQVSDPYITDDPREQSIYNLINNGCILTWKLLINLQPYIIDNCTINDNMEAAQSYLDKIKSVYFELKRLED